MIGDCVGVHLPVLGWAVTFACDEDRGKARVCQGGCGEGQRKGLAGTMQWRVPII